MDLTAFEQTLQADAPPPDATLALQALWHDAQGRWSSAHELAQRDTSRAGAWVHAYLHRKEGDQGNAAYWYRRAGRAMGQGPLDEEWRAIARTLLADPDEAG